MWTCPKCERALRSPNQWHNCIKVHIGDLFKDKAAELEFIINRLLAHILEWENVAVSATKNCIVFVHHKTFLIVRPMKTQLNLKFYSTSEQSQFPIVKSSIWNSKYENHIRISHPEDITAALIDFIKQSYKLC